MMTTFVLTATKETENITKEFWAYHQALTTAINLQNVGYEVTIKRKVG